jgi:hypothetical protein
MTLEGVTGFRVPGRIIKRTERSLRAAGRDGYELFVLWTGRLGGTQFDVVDGHVPKQTSAKTKNGLLVTVEGEALHKLNVWLYESGQVLAAQVHAHPTVAFHSDTDDAYPIVTTLGGLSLVAADFCRHGLLAPSSAAYRLGSTGWTEAPLSIIEVVR